MVGTCKRYLMQNDLFELLALTGGKNAKSLGKLAPEPSRETFTIFLKGQKDVSVRLVGNLILIY